MIESYRRLSDTIHCTQALIQQVGFLSLSLQRPLAAMRCRHTRSSTRTCVHPSLSPHTQVLLRRVGSEASTPACRLWDPSSGGRPVVTLDEVQPGRVYVYASSHRDKYNDMNYTDVGPLTTKPYVTPAGIYALTRNLAFRSLLDLCAELSLRRGSDSNHCVLPEATI